MEVRKAVIPAAGWGMRFLPSTKAVPKAMLPVVDKPLLQYAVEEAFASGIEQVIVVTPSASSAIEGHFEPSPELERALEQKGEERLLEEVRRIAGLGSVCYVRQKEQLGLGDAVLAARDLVGRPSAALDGVRMGRPSRVTLNPPAAASTATSMADPSGWTSIVRCAPSGSSSPRRS